MNKPNFILFLTFSLLFVIGCSKITPTLSLNNNDNLSIERVIFPSYLTFLDFGIVPQDVIYNNTPEHQNKIQIIFNQPIKQKEDLFMFYFANGYFVPIVDATKSNRIDDIYVIKDNILEIEAIKGGIPNGLVALVLPAEIISISNKKLTQREMLWFSRGVPGPFTFLIYRLNMSPREKPSHILAQQANSTKPYYFLRKDGYLYSSKDKTQIVLPVYRGENFVVLEQDDEWAKVRIYFPNVEKIRSLKELPASTDLLSLDYTTFEEGYIPATELIEIPAPYHKGSVVTVERELNTNEIKLTLAALPLSSDEVYLPEQTKTITNKQISIYETALIWQNVELGGRSYIVTKFKNGRELNPLLPEAHEPQVFWSDTEYKIYKDAREQYLKKIKDVINAYDVTPEYEQYKKDVIQRFNKIALMQDIWVSWGAENKVQSLSWFAARTANSFGTNVQEKERIKHLINNLKEDFELNMVLFIRESLEKPEVDQNLINPEQILGLTEPLSYSGGEPFDIEKGDMGYAPEITAKESRQVATLVKIKRGIHKNSWLVEEYGTKKEYILIFRFGLNFLNQPPENGQIMEVHGILKNEEIIEVLSPDKLMPVGKENP